MSQTTDATLNIFPYCEPSGHLEIHFKNDRKSGLHSIVAIDSTKRGPALGGCRFIHYPNTQTALQDAIRLAHGMSYKSALCQLPIGGGKGVILRPNGEFNRDELFQSFGRFVHEFKGRYITAMDSGPTTEDMVSVAKQTPYVASNCRKGKLDDDPAPYTAIGIRRGMEAAVKFHLKRDNMEGLHIAIQGVGHVGYNLAQQLHERGASLTVCDTHKEHTERCVKSFGAKVVPPESIYQVKCDIFSPCALGAILNDHTIPTIKASIIAGCANNQLAEKKHGEVLFKRGILYVPDYAINPGGLIYCAIEYLEDAGMNATDKINGIYDTLMEIFEQSKRLNEPTHVIADRIAEERL